MPILKQRPFVQKGTNPFDMEASVADPEGTVELCEVVDEEDFHYLIQFTPKVTGVHTLSVKHKSLHISGKHVKHKSLHISGKHVKHKSLHISGKHVKHKSLHISGKHVKHKHGGQTWRSNKRSNVYHVSRLNIRASA